jgi:hypothetical protein
MIHIFENFFTEVKRTYEKSYSSAVKSSYKIVHIIEVYNEVSIMKVINYKI